MLKIEMETESEAFEGGEFGVEIACILHKLAVTIELEVWSDTHTDDTEYLLRDTNGNSVGIAYLS